MMNNFCPLVRKTKANRLLTIHTNKIFIYYFNIIFIYLSFVLKYNVFEVRIWKLENMVKMKCFFLNLKFFFLNLNILIQSKACEACVDLLGQFRKACEACGELDAQQCI